jgi:hypothetical protein
MKNRRKLFIKLFAILFLTVGVLISFNTIMRYLLSPWLVGAHYIPADFIESEMIGIYLNLLFCLLLIISSTMVLTKKKNASNMFLLALVLYAVAVPVSYFVSYHYNYILSELWLELLLNFIVTGIPIYLILLEQKRIMIIQHGD